MNVILYNLFFFLFLLLPPALLAIRLARGRPEWWLMVVLIAVLGWLSWFGAFAFYQQHIAELIEQGAELPEGWDSDGAAGVFALYMGWLISLLYFLPWLALYLLAGLARRGMRKLSQPGSNDDPA